MKPDWGLLFDNFGIKTVRLTDKSKNAYVLSADQVKALAAAGVKPSGTRPGVPFEISILCDRVRSVRASYYHSQRRGSGRGPEPRMGQEIIRDWLNVGDTVVIGNIGSQVFAAKVSDSVLRDVEITAAIANATSSKNRKEILRKAKRAKGRPKQISVTRSEFQRNPWVVMAALIRAGGECETPKCTRPLFKRQDGGRYLEVHHIIPLGEGGDDTLANAAALCPHCHRELHFGKRRKALQKKLADRISRRRFD